MEVTQVIVQLLQLNISVIWTSFFYRFRNGSTFEGIAYSYNDKHFGIDWMKKRSLNIKERMLDRRRLSDAWFKWHAYMWNVEMGRALNVPDDLEIELQNMIPLLKQHFTRKWSGSHHFSQHKAPGKQ